jgi:hypothetical protein
VITGIVQFINRKTIIGQLGFLQCQDVRPGDITPGKDMWQANIQ